MNIYILLSIDHARWLMSRVSILFLVSFISLLTPHTAKLASAEISLTFGTYAADKPTVTVKKYRPFLRYLAAEMSKILGEPVTIRMKVAKEYETGIDHLASGGVDFARFGPASYIMVKERNPNVQIIAMESKNGGKRFNGIIAVHSESKIQTLSQLRQHSFAFGDQLSTIGRYLAQSHLIAARVTSKELSGYEYLGRHDRVGTAVGAGKFTAGALKESTFRKLVAAGVPIRSLFKFENVTKPWLSSSSMEMRVLQAMRQVMLIADDQEVLNHFAKDGFVEGTDADYNFVREAIKQSRNF